MKYYLCKKCKTLCTPGHKEKICPRCGAKLGKQSAINVTQMKRLAWKSFAQCMKQELCVKSTGSPKEGICYTCKKHYPIEKLQLGHLVNGRRANDLFDEKNVELQCFDCNVGNHGRQGIFLLNKIEDATQSGMSYEEAVRYYEQLFFAKKRKPYTIEELHEIYVTYSRRADVY